jgi:hypothetical protein
VDTATAGNAVDPALLVRRRQFILGPAPAQRWPGWRKVSIGSGDLTLLAHPELAVTQAVRGDIELTLLGSLLDPGEPSLDDEAIVTALTEAAETDDRLDAELRRLAGRWALIVARDAERSLVHDPCGLRQVFYAARPDGVWCASEPGLLADELGLEVDPRAREFLSSLYVRSYREWHFPAAATPFVGMGHLLPNHRLDLASGAVRRYWPRERRGSLPLEDGARRTAGLLRGVVEAAARRGPLALALTAGVDSRAVLAAARNVATDIYGYTLTGPPVSGWELDADVAELTLARVGLAHHRIDCAAPPDAAHVALSRANVFGAHDAWFPITAALLREYPQERVSLTGSGSELGRRGYRRFRRITPAILRRFDNLVASDFARDAVEQWFAELGDVRARTGHHPSDIWYQENRLPNWLAGGHLEFDIAQDTLAPFNCRAMVDAMQAVPHADHDPPHNRLHRRIIEILWPELLTVPINPLSRQRFLYEESRMGFFRHLARTPLFDPFKIGQLRLRQARRATRGRDRRRVSGGA